MLRQKEVVAPLELSLSFFKQSLFLIFPSMPQNEAFLIDTPRTVTFLIIREPAMSPGHPALPWQGTVRK